ncbi:hypothetical protein LTR86_010745 [Recurvomyces mirabilis]|nr:hypothetical protein LTR86_010745 [Recurvomyces mirabilis]
MATSRLRKTFAYPDSDSEPSDLDEEHQEQLINTLQAEDTARTTLYRNLFSAIPIIGALFFLCTLLFSSKTAQERLLALLSASSLCCTAYVLLYMPLEAPRRKGKTAVYKVEAAKGPVEAYLVYLNAALAGLLSLACVVSLRKVDYEGAWRQALPAVILGLTLFVRQQLAPLDLEELQKAKYDYKGA